MPSLDEIPAYPWTPEQGDGTYRNPIICADYSDPDVIRDGNDYWLTASSFHCTPGLPILHSSDLVNWRLVGHALKNLPHERYRQVQTGQGVWAPAIRKHDGRYWIFNPTPDEGIFVLTAEHPAGAWSEPHALLEGKGLIDPCPLWDDDGQAYLVHAFAGSRTGGYKNRLQVRPMSPDARRILDEGKVVFHEPQKHPTLEGPKFHKDNGFYYILAPAGGVTNGWQVVLRSRSIYGPYEDRIVLAQRDTPINGPHQGALVDTPTGQWWFVHFQDLDPYGRITHLQPVRWEDGWPLMGVEQDEQGVGKPVLRHAKPDVPGKHPVTIPQTSDDFHDATLQPQWQWHANHRDDWHSLTARPGELRLFAQPTFEDLGRQPNLLLQKFPAFVFNVETSLELGGQGAVEAGLIVAGRTHAAVALRRDESGKCRLMWVLDNNEAVAQQSIERPSARLRVEVAPGALCRFFAGPREGALHPVGQPFQATEGHWIGAKVGLFCRGGRSGAWCDADAFRFCG